MDQQTPTHLVSFRAGAAAKPADIAAAADCIAAGQTIGFLNRTVCALIGASDTRAFADEVIRIKGEKRRTKPVAAFVSAEEIAGMVDPTKIPQALVPLLTQPDRLRETLQGLVLMRLPITKQAAAGVPPHLLSYRGDGTPVFMTADPGGYQPLDDLWQACRARGVRFLSGTSMNASGSPEIVDQAEGIAFAEAAALPMFLADHDHLGWPAGSPTIVEVRQDDVVLVRDGFIPLWVFEQMFGVPIGLAGDARAARHEQITLDRAACALMAPGALCRHLMGELDRQRLADSSADPRLASTAMSEFDGLAPLVLIIFFGFLAVGMPPAALSLHLRDSLGFGASLIGWVIGLQSIATVLSRHTGGTVSDNSGPKRAVLLGLPLASLSGLLYLASVWAPFGEDGRLGLLLLGRVAAGLGESLFITATMSWGMARLGPKRAGRVMSWQGIAIFAAIGAGAPLGLAVQSAVGFAGVAALTALCPLIAWAVAWRLPAAPTSGGARVPFYRVLALIWRPGSVLLLASVPFAAMAAFIALAFAARDWAGAGTALGCFGVGYVAVRLLFPGLPDRFGGVRVAFVSIVIEAVGQLLLWRAPGPEVAILGAALTGIGFSLVFPCMGVEATRRLPPEQRGRAVGNFLAFFDLAIGLTGPVVGLIASGFGYSAIFLAGAVCLAAALLLLPTIRMMGVRT
jgi:MFS family permease/tRNA A37 threonylcarbamoyladenosine synthetase subunit TsaC/SUA5/YrdC